MIAGVRIFAIFGLFAVAVPTLAGERAALEEAWSALYGKSGRDAVATADRVMENYPETSEAWQVLGRAYMRRAGEVNIFRKISRFENSLKAYERAAELDPGNMEAQLALLTVYTMLPKSMGGGEERATAQLQVMAQAVPGLDELGRALQAKVEEDEEQAFAAMLRAIETNPDEPRFRVNLIQHYSDMADWDEAWRALDEARADFPDDIRLQRRGGTGRRKRPADRRRPRHA